VHFWKAPDSSEKPFTVLQSMGAPPLPSSPQPTFAVATLIPIKPTAERRPKTCFDMITLT